MKELSIICLLCEKKLDPASPSPANSYIYIHRWVGRVDKQLYFHLECWNEYAGENWIEDFEFFMFRSLKNMFTIQK